MLQGRKRLEWSSLCSHCCPSPLSQPPSSQGRASQCLSWALGLSQGNQAELAPSGSNGQVWEGAETWACSGRLPAPATLSLPKPGSPQSRRPLPDPFPHILFSGIFKRTSSTPLPPAEGGPSSPPHAVPCTLLPFKKELKISPWF